MNGEPAQTVKFTYKLYYPLWVGEYHVNVDNKDNIPGILGGGSASYDPKKKILTFKGNVTGVTGTNYQGNAEYTRIINSNDDLTINGSATLLNDDAAYGICIDKEGGTLTINGDIHINGDKAAVRTYESDLFVNGNIKAEGVSDGIYVDNTMTVCESAVVEVSGSQGISAYEFILNGGHVKATSTSWNSSAISGRDSIVINSGEVYALNKEEESEAIDSSHLLINDGKITAENLGTNSVAIMCTDMIVKSGIVKAVTKGTISKGIRSSNITIEGGEVTAVSEKEASEALSTYSLFVSGGKLYTEGAGISSCAINSAESIVVNGGNVEAYLNDDSNAGRYVVKAKDVSVKSGKLTILGLCNGINCTKQFSAYGGITDVEVTGNNALYCNNFEINAGTVNAKGVKQGICADNGYININGGYLEAEGSEYAVCLKKCDNASNITIDDGVIVT